SRWSCTYSSPPWRPPTPTACPDVCSWSCSMSPARWFVTEVWHIYLLIGILQASSAAFTPTFQATIPDIVTKESDYTRALSASQVAYTMETLLSPVLAAIALTFKIGRASCRERARH